MAHRLSPTAYHYAFVTPALALSVVIVLGPGLLTFAVAFTDWDGISEPLFVGLSNSSELFRAQVFWAPVVNNVQWAVIFLTIPMVIALVVASLLLTRKRCAAVYDVLFLLPYVLPPIATAVIWQNIMFDPVSGLLGFISRNYVSIENPLTDTRTALSAVAAVDIWHFWG